MSIKNKQEAQNPLILRCHRLMEAFAKSDDERDFYIDRLEGFLIYVDLDKTQDDLDALERELTQNADRYCAIPKLSFYETKKIMEGFVNEKVYDIDTKEKLLDIIQSKEARENFLEFIYDHHSEQEKWQQFYQERSRIRIIEWLRQNHFYFVFEEDLDFPRSLLEKLKQSLFQSKVGKDIQNARKVLVAKAKTYYSSEALNPRPKRGRPPKQAAKPEIEPQMTSDIYTTVSLEVRPFLFSPDMNTSSAFSIFSSKFDSDEDQLSKRLLTTDADAPLHLKLASLRSLSTKWVESEEAKLPQNTPYAIDNSFDDDDDDFDDDDDDVDFDDDFVSPKTKKTPKKAAKTKTSSKQAPAKDRAKAPKPTKSVKAAKQAKAVKPEKTALKAKPKLKSPAKSKISEKPKAKRIMPAVKKDKPKKLTKITPKKK